MSLTQRTTAHSCVGVTVGLESIYSEASVVEMTIPSREHSESARKGYTSDVEFFVTGCSWTGVPRAPDPRMVRSSIS